MPRLGAPFQLHSITRHGYGIPPLPSNPQDPVSCAIPVRRPVELSYSYGFNVVIGDDARIGDEVTIGKRVKIGKQVTIGDGVNIGNGVTIGNKVTIVGNTTAGHATISDNSR